jgi:hypothetical protein
MKKMSLIVALMIAMPLFSQAKVVTCRGTDRGNTGVKFLAQGDMKEQNAFGQTFAVGNFKIKITEPGKPVWEVTLPLAVASYPNEGKANIADEEGGSVYEAGRGLNQINVSDMFGGGSYVRYWAPAHGSEGASSYIINVECKGFNF